MFFRYDSYIVAETALDASSAQPESNEDSSSAGGVNPARGGGGAFNALAGYIFGGNERKEKMAMTMPVFSDSQGRMQFVVRSSDEVQCHNVSIFVNSSSPCLHVVGTQRIICL